MIDVKQIEVWMHGRQVGRLALTPQRPQTCAFEYTAEWLQEGFSISPFELPLTPGLKIAPYKPFDGHFGVFTIGLERITACFLGIANVKECSMFPRDINRVAP